MLDLTGHDRFFHTLVFEEAQHLAELANADPGQIISQAFNLWIGLFTDGGHGDAGACFARTFQNKKRKSPVSGNET